MNALDGALAPDGPPESPTEAPDANVGSAPAAGFYRMEALDRGLVAVLVPTGVYLSWRMLGTEYAPDTPEYVAYRVYRDGALQATVSDSTNYLDSGGTQDAHYTVRALIDGSEGTDCPAVVAWAESYLRIPLQKPANGTTPAAPKCALANEVYEYSAGDGSAADLDGDGAYDLLLKWDPSNAKDNSQSGCTGNVLIDAYTLSGERLYRIDLGVNIRAGAHYTQLLAYDFDGDGKAELALKTAPGTRDGTGAYLALGPAANDNDNDDYRSVANASGRTGYVLTGAEYLTVFEGKTGKELATVPFDQAREQVSAWGDSYGNRVDRFLAGVAYLDDTGLPSLVWGRGYYTRTTLTAWTFRDGVLKQSWKFDSNKTPSDAEGRPFTGQGAHSLSIANVDGDPNQEVIYGAMTVDHDGKGLCSTGYGHGDALHVGEFVAAHPGLEAFMPHEDGEHPSYDVHDPRTCEIISEGPTDGKDTARGVADDVSPDNPGSEVWTSSSLLDAASAKVVGERPSSVNFLVYWDGDESRELENGTTIAKYGGGTLLSCSDCSSNNTTKSTPTLSADLLGDWREELVWKEADSSALRIYTTTSVTERRIYTLMHDPQYRTAIAWQNVGYNQPPHPGFHIGAGMIAPPQPNIRLR